MHGLFFDEKGKVRSASVLYAFMFALLFTGLYIGAYMLLLDPLNRAFSGLPVFWQNVLQYSIPAIAGNVVPVVLALLLHKNKKLIAGAFIWMTALLVAILLLELIVIDWSDPWGDYRLFVVIIALPYAVSIIVGAVPVMVVYLRSVKRQKLIEERAKTRPSYYNT